MDEPRHVPISPFRTGLAGRCPRCGKGPLFAGFLTLAPRCTACGLDYSFADSADGPAVFVMFIAGFIVVGAGLWLEFTYSPAWWVHVLVQLPILILVTLGPLRPFKGVLIALQYANKAEEGRVER